MNAIHFSPHFPQNYFRFSVALKKLGVNVLGIADARYEHLRDELKAALTEYYLVDDMEDYRQLLKAVAFLTFRHGKIDLLDSFNEHWLGAEAQLRTDFNIPGVKTDQIETLKRKSRMKEKYAQAGIAVARGRVVRTLDEALALAREVGYPVVVKPDIGVGATNTHVLRQDADVARFIANKPPVDYIMEEFIDGDIFSFDGLADHDGKPVFHTAHTYMCGIMEVVNDDNHVYYYSLRDIPADLREAGLKTLAAFRTAARFFHLEFFRRRADGRIVALEVNMRPPGGFTTDMFNFANDIDIYQEWANVVVDNRFRAQYDRKYHCCYVSRKHRFKYAHSHQEVIDRMGPAMVYHAPISGIFSRALGDYGYLLRSPDLEEIMAAVRFVHALA